MDRRLLWLILAGCLAALAALAGLTLVDRPEDSVSTLNNPDAAQAGAGAPGGTDPAGAGAADKPPPSPQFPEDLPTQLSRLTKESAHRLRVKIRNDTMMQHNALDRTARNYLDWSPENLREGGITQPHIIRHMMKLRNKVLTIMTRHCAAEAAR